MCTFHQCFLKIAFIYFLSRLHEQKGRVDNYILYRQKKWMTQNKHYWCPTLFLLVIYKNKSVTKTVMSERDMQQVKTCFNKYHYIQACWKYASLRDNCMTTVKINELRNQTQTKSLFFQHAVPSSVLAFSVSPTGKAATTRTL